MSKHMAGVSDFTGSGHLLEVAKTTCMYHQLSGYVIKGLALAKQMVLRLDYTFNHC